MSRVQFERTETIVDGPLVRVESWTQQGDVLEVRPDGRVRVDWEIPTGDLRCACSTRRKYNLCEPGDVSCIRYAR